ncbi:type IVB secretion system protein IcmV [Legionella worsleiensis]|uniref:IcmV n=1 Tax=Legionella worsleiensis TaxID=45076 RepID=A0A0W1AFC8_9GAMM|nr:type IVB secretion system protein IcmV [Legionella worsleiensis]KTD79998.1 IcmV [Legionella worsleiensis]STY32470.1 IcmV [Legionella worsleiensis]
MKKKSGTRIGNMFRRIVNIRTWSDWDRMNAFTLYLINGFKRLFISQKNVEVESFDLAVNKLKLTDAELQAKQNALFRLSMVMLTVAGLIFFYSGYQLLYGSIKAVVVSLVVMMIALVLAFRYHFWYFQIKHKKLGCTVIEWYKQGILGENE